MEKPLPTIRLWGCPCQFNARPTHGNCEEVAGSHILNGSYDNKVRLDGFNRSLIGSWPGPIHEGHGKASYYIDDRTDEVYTFEALSNIITGKAGGGPFAVYASTIEEFQEPKRATVKFQTKDIRSRVLVFGGSEMTTTRDEEQQKVDNKKNRIKILFLLKHGSNL